MSVKCQVIMDAMECLAPRHLAENWDNVGLLLGSPAQTITKIVVTLDVTQAVVDQAIADGIDMIVTHHPILFKAVNRIRTDLPQGKLLSKLLQANIAVYAAHTNLDSATGGVNDILSNLLQLQDTKPLTVSYAEKMYKLVVFVPTTHMEMVRSAITDAGAGQIGAKYSHCTFVTGGTGSFLPLDVAKPFVGKQGTLEYVEESRLETIVAESMSRRVIKAMLKVHPYEEVAYDLYPLLASGETLGLGRIGKMAVPVVFADFIKQVKAALCIEHVSVAGTGDRLIKKVAVCGGSGASLINKAVFAGADVLVTGDVKYHEAQEAIAAGITVVDAGHFATEQPVVSYVADYLITCANKNKWAVTIAIDTVNEDSLRIC